MFTDFYQITDLKKTENTISCALSYNADHEIFKGHFPGNPIVPGVCTMELIQDLLEHALQKKIQMIQASSIKYLSLITPDMQPSADLSWTINVSGHCPIVAVLHAEGKILFKMNATYMVEA